MSTTTFPPGTTLEHTERRRRRRRQRQRRPRQRFSFDIICSRTSGIIMPSIKSSFLWPMVLITIAVWFLVNDNSTSGSSSMVMVEAFLFFGNKKKRRQREQEREAQLLLLRLQEQKEARRQLVYLAISAIVITAILLVVGTQFLGFFKKARSEEDDNDGLRGNRPTAPVNVILIMRAPTSTTTSLDNNEEDTSTQGRMMMGQQHLRQLLEMSNVNIIRVILVVPTSGTESGNDFNHNNNNHQNHNPDTSENDTTTGNDFQNQLQSMGIRTYMIVAAADMEASFPKTINTSKKKPLMVFLATDDFRSVYSTNTTTSLKSGGDSGIVGRLFIQCLSGNWNPTAIYMDPPTFVPLNELKQMKRLLLFHQNQNTAGGTSATTTTPKKVYVGYTKHIMEPVVNAIQLSNKINHSHIFFCHNHNYDQSDLPMVLSKYFEGSLKHMAMEELCIFATYFDITVEHIRRFKVNTGKLFTDKLTIWKPGTNTKNPEYLKDYVRCAFKITSVDDISCSIMCDRCGGVTSFVVVKDSQGNEVQKFEYTSSTTVSLSEKNNNSSSDSSYYGLLKQLKHEIISQIGSSNNDNKQTDKKISHVGYNH